MRTSILDDLTSIGIEEREVEMRTIKSYSPHRVKEIKEILNSYKTEDNKRIRSMEESGETDSSFRVIDFLFKNVLVRMTLHLSKNSPGRRMLDSKISLDFHYDGKLIGSMEPPYGYMEAPNHYSAPQRYVWLLTECKIDINKIINGEFN